MTLSNAHLEAHIYLVGKRGERKGCNPTGWKDR
jgi:hypothetical protein